MSTHLVPALDLGWLVLETSDTPNHVGALMIFERPGNAGPTYMRDLTDHLRSADALVKPWNLHLRKGLMSGLMPMLDTSGTPDMEYHVRRLALPQPGGERELGELVSRLHANALDLRRPMWECHVIEGLEDNRFALFIKIHHVLIDGVSGMRMFQRAMSPVPDEIRPAPWAYVETSRPRRKAKAAENTEKAAAVPTRRGLAMKSIANLYPMLRPGARRVPDLVTAFSAPSTVLNGRVTVQRRLSTQRYPLARLKRVAEAAKVSVNDVVLAICGAGLRRLLAEAGELPERTSLNACIPISVRAADEISVGTAISFGFADLATNESDPVARLERVHASTRALKEQVSALPRTTVGAFTLAVMGPYALQQALGLAGRTRPMFNVVISNVPGPTEQLHLFGARLEAMYPASVLYHGQALNITCVRYGDDLNFGFTAWRDALPHVHRISVYCADALAELESAFELSAAP
ncbi:MAG: wax ester/triacylglycerol synthase family O-acyltransferase [Polycyclovorans sp.]|jgi:diacylglycerol O-acyltransferase / wax synthase|nr:wax ester/triacylglycerol synthase family O-acyltransferase [Polycyclovorans sp.]|tara:strand:+ start:42158 stop:43549 length:1392 start_codon:yes stop_codon:yes gene_type:complete